MSTAVKDTVQDRLKEVQATVTSVDKDIAQKTDQRAMLAAELDQLKQQHKTLSAEHRQLQRVAGILGASDRYGRISTNGNGSNGASKSKASNGKKSQGVTGRSVDYPELLQAVIDHDEPIKTPELAAILGTAPNMIARKLLKLRDDGKLTGDKESGFSAA